LARNRRKSSAKSRFRKSSAGSEQTIRAQNAQPRTPRAGRWAKRKVWLAALGVVVAVLSIGFAIQFLSDGSGNAPVGTRSDSGTAAAFVGSETCAGCHQAEAKLWHGSQHKHAMDHATDKSVLGDFNDASFDYYGVRSRFFRRDGRFFVETDGPDGKLATFEVKYTFGLDPLQQYLVEFSDGRLQALSLAWDSRPKEKGGQRWFHLYPNEEIKHDDILHWTKLNQNWNFMCAECHSTGVRKNYDAASDRFATTWSEISVGCEACHGQGSRHVAWAHDKQSWWPFGKHDNADMGLLVRFGDRNGVAWHQNAETGQPERSIAPTGLRKEVETCGLCHARRGQFSEDWIPGQWLSDTHAIALLSRGLYSADGQMLDEVYNYGSFKQSKMFAAGVTCSDCHDPHSAKLRLSGGAVCLQCHSKTYSEAAHHHHEGTNPSPSCVSCHMPARTYMVVDTRHDHSFRIPRADLSTTLQTPNACIDCHKDKSPEWAASAIEDWFGSARKGFQNYADAFHAAWTDTPDAATLLATVARDNNAPAFARASALTELNSYLSPSNIDLARKGLSDPDPMVRIGALDMLQDVPAAQLWPLVSPLLSDPSRGVRLKAVALLAGIPSEGLSASDREQFKHVAEEFIAAQRLNADRPEARTILGSFYARSGRAADAEAEYKAALRLSPRYAPAAINLADLYRQLGRDGEGEIALRAAVATSPQDAGLHHALGLTLIRLNRRDDALEALHKAAELAPDQARYAYVYAIGLHSSGRGSDAMTILKDNLTRHPGDRDTLLALISFSRDAGEIATALEYAEQLAKIEPTNRDLAELIQDLRRQVTKPEER
jgi:predicted CXXCH cytochrome family protein